MLDSDDSNYIDKYELSELGDSLKKNWSEEDSSTLMNMLDKDDNEKIHYPEFRDFIMTMLTKSFDRLDANKNGVLSNKELEPVSKAFGRDHNEIMTMFGHKKRVTKSMFVDFVVSYCIHGIRSGQVLRMCSI